MSKNFLFIGGDLRQLYAAEKLSEKGQDVSLYGFGERDCFSYIKQYDCIVLPAPFTRDAKNIFAPLCEEEIPFSVIEKFNTPETIIGGNCDFLKEAVTLGSGTQIIDLLKNEEYNILNASATAEGAVSLAVENTSFNLRDSSVLVCGYGKIGKILALDLQGMGAKVFVAARKVTDRAYASISGFTPLEYFELPVLAHRFDIIFNTVPTLVIKEDTIKNLKKRCLLLDLASKPGGIDFASADACGIKHLHALGLPGKYSPETSGEIIAGIILKSTGGI